ncbi:MAG: hypothetical protein ACP5G1_03730 [Nanopusillaceae archaeon]
MKILIIHGQTFEFDDAEKSMLGLKNLLEKEGYEVKFFLILQMKIQKFFIIQKLERFSPFFIFQLFLEI